MRSFSFRTICLFGFVSTITCKVFNVKSYGAIGDGVTDDTNAVRAAVQAISNSGSGTLLFPGGGSSYSTAPFNLSSNMHVEIETGATVLGSSKVEWPLIVVPVVWPGFGCARDADCNGNTHSAGGNSEDGRLMHQSLLFSWSTQNVSVGGGGTIDCNGAGFESCSTNLTHAPCSGYARPQCVFWSNVTGARFEGVTVLNSPDWTLHFSSVDKLHVKGVNVTQPGGGNRDGIDIDSCNDVVVEDSYIASGDDTIAVKSGINPEGLKYHRPSRNVLFRNITTGGGYGLTIGSEVSGGVINITFEDITVSHQTAGIHIKAPAGRGGYIQNVTYRNIHLKSVRQCILVCIGGGGPQNLSGITMVSDILFENIRCDIGTTSSYDLSGFNRSFPIKNVRFNNVTMGAAVKGPAACGNIQCTCDANTYPCPRCCSKAAPMVTVV